jgi:Arc/MetJ family transcription regulator
MRGDETMRTTIDLPADLVAQAMSASGAKSKRDAVRWALEEALRQRAIQEMLSGRVKVDFAITPEDLEKREVREQYGRKRPRRHR